MLQYKKYEFGKSAGLPAYYAICGPKFVSLHFRRTLIDAIVMIPIMLYCAIVSGKTFFYEGLDCHAGLAVIAFNDLLDRKTAETLLLAVIVLLIISLFVYTTKNEESNKKT